jgi:putative ABC transport system permease protein
MMTILNDIKYGFRMLWKNPGFTAVAVLTLALGIGANTAVFSIFNAVLLAPLPYKQPDRLVQVFQTMRNQDEGVLDLSLPTYLDLKERNHTFEDMAVFFRDTATLTGDGDPQRINCFAISSHFLDVLGVTVSTGRPFMLEESRPGKDSVAILDHGLWQGRFMADPNIIGKTIQLDQRPVTIVGILPQDFRFHAPPRYPLVDAFVPLLEQEAANAPRNSGGLNVIGRLKPVVTMAQAREDLAHVSLAMARDYAEYQGTRWTPRALDEVLLGQVKPALVVILGTVCCVMLIVCVNVGGLLLVWLLKRRSEMCLRVSLGASRIRILRQFMTESLLLTGLGAGLGLLLAYDTVQGFAGLIPSYTPIGGTIGINTQVLGFTLGTTLALGLIFGVALSLARFDANLYQGLAEAGLRTTGCRWSRRLQHTLVSAQVSVAFLMMICAGLMVRTFMTLVAVDPGFNPRNVSAVSIQLPQAKAGQAGQFFAELVRRVERLPGVQNAAVVKSLPMRGPHSGAFFSIAGRPTESDKPLVEYTQTVSPDYFQVMQTSLLQGRHFTSTDQTDATRVVIINSTMARKYWPEQDPLGKHIEVYGAEWQVVGIVEDIRKFSLLLEEIVDPVQPMIYFTHAQDPRLEMYLVFRSAFAPADLASRIRREVLNLDQDIPMGELISMQQIVTESIWSRRTMALLISTFGGLAFILAIAGVYGLVAYSVTQRTGEIGIRMALGAQQKNIFASVIRDGLKPVLIGLGIGLAGTPVVTRLIASKLYGVSTLDPATFGGVAIAMTAVATLACCLPAWKAAKTDPMEALRYE